MNRVINSGNGVYEDSVPALKNRITTDFETRYNNGYAIEVITGSAVFDLLGKPEFQQGWDALYETCTWATIFQYRPFIDTWYRVYREKHIPILVRSMERGQLKGLLPMVLLNTHESDPDFNRKSGRITGAGHYDAEYQTWLVAPSDGGVFIQKALTKLMNTFPASVIAFRFLPPDTPLEWIRENKHWSKRSIVQSYARPLINFKDPEPAKIFKRKHFKNKLNRLKRSGEVQFETITDLNSFESSLHEMALLYDFRQSAMFNKRPFQEDPGKKDFLLELFRLQLLHITVLKVNQATIAAVVAVKGNHDGIHLAGINCHSPFKARSYSPGFLHFILLAKQLADERIQYFDLSPGYDAYKDELANQHDVVRELVISPSLKFRIKRKIRNWIHARLVAAGMRPMTVELTLKKKSYWLRQNSAGVMLQKLAKRLGKKRKQQLYCIHTGGLQPGVNIPLHKNNLVHLMAYEAGKGAENSRWAFLEDAMWRLESGQHCFTWMENDRLLGCAWINDPDPVSPEKESNPATENALVLKSLFCHTAAKDRLPAFLHSVIVTAIDKEIYPVYIRAEDPLFCKALEDAGFRVV